MFSQWGFLIFFHLKDSVSKGDFKKHVQYSHFQVVPLHMRFTCPALGIWWATKVWAGHCQDPSALGEPGTAVLPQPWTVMLPMVPYGSREESRGCQALPLPCHMGPRRQVGWATTDAANCITRLATHNILSWVALLNLWLCYHFLVGFCNFLSPGSAVRAAQCESDRWINLTLGKKHQGMHLFFNKGTFDLGGFSIQVITKALKLMHRHKQETAQHDTRVRGKAGSGKKMTVAPKAGQTRTAAPHTSLLDGSGAKWVPSSP